MATEANPFKIIIESSKYHDARIIAGNWCYIESVETNAEAKEKARFLATRNGVIIHYKGQSFDIFYGKVPKRSKK